MNIKSLLLILGTGISLAFPQADPDQDGSSNTRLPNGSSSLQQKTITPSFHESGTPGGMAVGSVNTFSGQASTSVPLGSIDVRGKIKFPIGLGYSGNVREIVRADNRTSPSGSVGLGWDFSIPSISRNTMGTFTRNDDVYFADFGPYGGGQLLVNGSGKYYIANNPYADVTYDAIPSNGLSSDFNDQIIRWTVKFPDGVTYRFGELGPVNSNSYQTFSYTSYKNVGTMAISPYRTDSAKAYIYKWNLKEIQDAESANKLIFDYQKTNITQFVSSKGYTREAYIQTIKYLDNTGAEAEKWQFTFADKSADEWVAYPTTLPDVTPTPTETKYLSKI
jgi:hypothetical protein